MTAKMQKTIKIATGSKTLLGNPFAGERGDNESIKQAFRKWLLLVHQGNETNIAFITVEKEMCAVVALSSYWRIRCRATVMKKLDELVQKHQDGYELLIGKEPHAEVILSYIKWRSRSVHLAESNNPLN